MRISATIPDNVNCHFCGLIVDCSTFLCILKHNTNFLISHISQTSPNNPSVHDVFKAKMKLRPAVCLGFNYCGNILKNLANSTQYQFIALQTVKDHHIEKPTYIITFIMSDFTSDLCDRTIVKKMSRAAFTKTDQANSETSNRLEVAQHSLAATYCILNGPIFLQLQSAQTGSLHQK